MSVKIKSHWTVLLTPAVFLPLLMGEGMGLRQALPEAIRMTLVAQFCAILPHELAHLAGSFQMGIRRGTLLFGGIVGAWCPDDETALGRLTPWQRLFVVSAGPGCNLLIAGLCALLPSVLPLQVAAQTSALRYQIQVFNLFMGLINLLPVFPLDGGRILMDTFLLMGLSPLRVLKCLRLSALLFGCGWMVVLLKNGIWTDWLFWLLLLGVSARLLADRDSFMREMPYQSRPMAVPVNRRRKSPSVRWQEFSGR